MDCILDVISQLMLMAIPVFAWEISLASFLFFKGFKPEAEARLTASPTAVGAISLPSNLIRGFKEIPGHR